MSARSLCPGCRKPTSPDHAPFCSRGCRDRDLVAWFGEAYRVPVRGNDDEDGNPPDDG